MLTLLATTAATAACQYTPARLATFGDAAARDGDAPSGHGAGDMASRDGDASSAPGDAEAPRGDGGGIIVDVTAWDGPWFALDGSVTNAGPQPLSTSAAHSALIGEGRFIAPGTSAVSALTSDGAPTVAWVQAGTPAEIVVSQRMPAGWAAVGTRPISPAPAQHATPAIALDNADRPIVTWLSGDGVHVRRLESGSWQIMDGTTTDLLSDSAEAQEIVLRYDSDGSAEWLTVLIRLPNGPQNTSGQLRLYSLNLTTDVLKISLVTTPPFPRALTLTSILDRAFFAFEADTPNTTSDPVRRVFVREYSNSAIKAAGTLPLNTGISQHLSYFETSARPQIQVGATGLWLAWEQVVNGSGNAEILVAQLPSPMAADREWSLFTPDSSGNLGGMTQTLGDSRQPHLRVQARYRSDDTKQDQVFITWSENRHLRLRAATAEQDVDGADATLRYEWGPVLRGYTLANGMVRASGLALTNAELHAADASRSPSMMTWTAIDSQAQARPHAARLRCTTLWEEYTDGGSAGLSRSDECSELPQIAVGADGRVVVVWEEQVTDTNGRTRQVYAKRYDPGLASWSDMDGSGGGGGLTATVHDSMVPALALDPQGQPVVAWRGEVPDGPGTIRQIHLRRFTSGTWRSIANSDAPAGISNAATEVLEPRLAWRGTNEIIAVWRERDPSTGRYGLVGSHYDGSSWIAAGRVAESSDLTSGDHVMRTHDVAIGGDGTIYVAWSERNGSTGISGLHVGRAATPGDMRSDWLIFEGSATLPVTATGDAEQPTLAVDSEGVLHMAWRQEVGTRTQIMYARYQGGAWITDAASDAHRQVSQSASFAIEPSITVTGEGEPIVAWADSQGENWQIFARRLDPANNTWIEVGTTAQESRGGLSRTPTASRQPSLAYGQGKLCVTWADIGNSALQIAVKCTDKFDAPPP